MSSRSQNSQNYQNSQNSQNYQNSQSPYITKDELTRMLAEHRQQIVADINALEKKLNSRIDNIKTNTAAIITEKLEQQDNQLAVRNNQITELKTATRELIKTATTQMAEKVYKRINDEMGPQIQNAVEWVNYNTQDTEGLINDYRKAVEHNHRAGGQKLLTDGKDKRVISEHVRTFWSEDD